MAIIVKIDGTCESIEPENGKVFSLKELQQAVEGYIQLVSIDEGEYAGRLMIIDEEGLIKQYPQLNINASEIVSQRIVGQVIIITQDEIE